MGGTISISIRFTERQHKLLKDYAKEKYPTYEVPECLHFLTWTNWISWFMHSPEFWVEPSDDQPDEVKAYLEEAPAIKELLDTVIDDSQKNTSYGLQKYPLPVGYGIVLYDLVNKQVFSSQGYSTPGKMYYSNASTAQDEMLHVIMRQIQLGMLDYTAINYYDKDDQEMLFRLFKEVPFAVSDGKNLTPHGGWSKEISQPFPNTIYTEKEGAKRLLAFMGQTKIYWSVLVQFSETLFHLTSYPEPTDPAEMLQRLKAINEFCTQWQWPTQLIPVEKLDPKIFPADSEEEENLEAYDLAKNTLEALS